MTNTVEDMVRVPTSRRELNAHQMAAVVTTAKQVIVTACPGSGKTSVIVARMQHMIAQGIPPREIVCVTFTRHAAAQLRERIGDEGRGVVIGTLHSFCLRMIREMGTTIGYEFEWLTIEDDEDAMLEQYDALTELGIMSKGPDGKRHWKLCKAKDWEKFANNVQAGLINPEDEYKVPDVFRMAWQHYMDRLRSQNTLTYGTILSEAYRLLQDKKALAIFRKKYRHFLIDEAQDTSHLQWSIVWRLVQKAHPDTLYVVGDLDQSIYEWRGAAPRDLLTMARSPKTTCFTLPTTYRFGPGIAEPSQRLIDHNKARLPTRIETGISGGTNYILDTVHTLAQVADMVRTAAANTRAKDVAVISRRHRPLIELEQILDDMKVPCRRIGKTADLRHSFEFRMCMAYIRCAANPRDRRAFARVATLEGITTEQMRDYRRHSADGVPIVTLWFSVRKGNPPPWRPEELETYLPLRDREHDYSAAIGLIREAILFQGLTTAAELERWFALADVQDEIAQSDSEDSVTLMTVHGAKGCQWPTVYVVDACEQVWPSGGSLKEGREEEERRLMYVGITRAMDRVIVIPTVCCEELRIMEPSRFIAEMIQQPDNPAER